MAVNPKDEKAARIKTLLDAYSIGVRGGVLTPCMEDENWFRSLIGLSNAPDSVVAEWGRTNGVRLPITLQRGLSEPDAVPTQDDGSEEQEDE